MSLVHTNAHMSTTDAWTTYGQIWTCPLPDIRTFNRLCNRRIYVSVSGVENGRTYGRCKTSPTSPEPQLRIRSMNRTDSNHSTDPNPSQPSHTSRRGPRGPIHNPSQPSQTFGTAHDSSQTSQASRGWHHESGIHVLGGYQALRRAVAAAMRDGVISIGPRTPKPREPRSKAWLLCCTEDGEMLAPGWARVLRRQARQRHDPPCKKVLKFNDLGAGAAEERFLQLGEFPQISFPLSQNVSLNKPQSRIQ